MSKQRPRLLVTRPEGQADILIAGAEVIGFDVVHVPCLEIQATDVELQRSDIESYDAIVFTSVNAVTHAHSKLPLPWNGVGVFAIGEVTAKELSQLGQSIVAHPLAPYNSESFIDLLNNQNAMPDRLLVVKGVGGRGLIEEVLSSGKTEVLNLDVYERRIPSLSNSQTTLIKDAFDVVSITSNETLDNYLSLATPHHSSLFESKLIVNSERNKAYARSLGFVGEIHVATLPGDQQQLECLTAIVAKHE